MIGGYNESAVEPIRSFMVSKGMNLNGVAGLLGNLYAESGLYSNNLQNSKEKVINMTDDQYTQAVDNGSYRGFCTDRFGYGLWQVTSEGRKTGYYNYVKSKCKSIADLQSQIEYIYKELTTSYKSVWNELCSPNNSVASCAEIVVCKYEVPGSVLGDEATKQKTIKTRTTYAQDFYDKYFSGSSKPVETPKKLIALSAGHYKYTSGKRCLKSIDPNETREWVLNDRIADKLQKILAEYDGVSVLRLDDTTGETLVSIQDRAVISNDANADFYLAIHHNAGINGGSGGGIVVYHYPTEVDKKEGTDLYNHLLAANGLKGNRSQPIKATNDLYEVCAPKAQSILVENGFMDSTHDTPIILTESYANESAYGLAQYFIDRWGLKKKTNSPTPIPTPIPTPSPIPTPKPDNHEEYETYTVIPHDTLYKIGKKFNVTVNYLLSINPDIVNPNKIKAGQIINVGIKQENNIPVKDTTTIESAKSYDKNLSRNFTASANLNLRTGAGTSKSKIVCIPKGNTVRCYGFYTSLLGVKWLLVQTTYNSTIYTGFCSSLYLK